MSRSHLICGAVGCRCKDVVHAEGLPREFRDDAVAVAQRREAGVTIKQIADDFGISEGCLQNWLYQADIEACKRPGTTQAESAELRELRDLRKRNRLLELEK